MVEFPPEGNTSRCVTARLDKATHSLTIDSKKEDPSAIAWGCFTDKINSTGWSSLSVHTSTSSEMPMTAKIYAAGFVEGLLTMRRINEFHSNVKALMDKDVQSDGGTSAVERVLRMSIVAWEQFAGGEAMIPPSDPVEFQSWVALLQLRGLRDGHNLAAFQSQLPPVSAYDLVVLNAHAEIPAIAEIYADSAQAKILSALQQGNGTSAQSPYTEPKKWARWLSHSPRGSAMVKRIGPAGDARDLLVGHVTWGDYSEMTRVWKNYYLDVGTSVSAVAMSSYPGCISSTDDYFVASSGMTVASTQLGVPAGGSDSRPSSNNGLPSFLRAVIAMRLATTPHMWSKVYGYITGISGGKQFLIADYNNLVPKTKLKNGTLFLVDALRTKVRATDVTEQLRTNGYFQSQGEPHFEDIRAEFGLATKKPQDGKASLLAQNAVKISNIADARGVLVNSLSEQGQQRPVSPRFDVPSASQPGPPMPAGGIDAKVANACLVSKLAAQAISGPPLTVTGEAFSWTKSEGSTKVSRWPEWPHNGLPDKWQFGWVDAGGPGGIAPQRSKFAECGQGTPAR
jgi:hypothetical protein